MNEDNAKFMLEEVRKILISNSIKYWLDCGTLLGAVRDNKFIPWDSDIDIGVFLEDFLDVYNAFNKLPSDFQIKKISNISLINSGLLKYYLKHIFVDLKVVYKGIDLNVGFYSSNRNFAIKKINKQKGFFEKILDYFIIVFTYENVVEVKSILPTSINIIFNNFFKSIPINFKHKIINTLLKMHKNIYRDNLCFSVPMHFFEKLSMINFYKMKFPVPSPVEKYLEYRYGKGWKIPKKDYVYFKEDQSIIKDDLDQN